MFDAAVAAQEASTSTSTSARGEAVVRAEGITKVFQEGREVVQVLRGVSLEFSPGEVVALEGPSGSGKTTFLSILGCILTPTAGEVVVAGERVSQGRPEQLRDVRRRAIG